MADVNRATRAVPAWVPVDVRNYVFHTEMGQPIRVLARSQACHASTIMRQVRKVEQRRDDPLVDRAIKALGDENANMPVSSALEIMQALRRLAMPHAMLAIALGMEQGVILQDNAKGAPDHGSKLPSETAMKLALHGWIEASQTVGRVLRYRITPSGRVALRELTAKSENRARAMAEAPATFTGAPKSAVSWFDDDDRQLVSRSSVQESPVLGLSRRKDRDGNPFLNRSMVRAAERLREDYELAQVGRIRDEETATDWQSILQAIESYERIDTNGKGAAAQVRGALSFLGPGLSEVALRCCCLLEGLEITEKQMGWAARSGKVVLRIALQRLVLHYEQTGELGPRIG
ncbi:MAG: DUF6456 domain-containing protein [Octadecabacter sp.]